MANRHSITRDLLFQTWEFSKVGGTYRSRAAANRFWDYVPDVSADECWEWQASRYRNGYGKLRLRLANSRQAHALAHRVSWIIHFGEIPAGLFVCHSCDNRSCVNPLHLFLGDDKANVSDMISKGRGRYWSKLTAADVAFIRGCEDVRYGELAARFGVTKYQIGNIKNGRSWKNLEA